MAMSFRIDPSQHRKDVQQYIDKIKKVTQDLTSESIVKIWYPKAICIASTFPYFDFYEQLLNELYKRMR